MVISNSLEVKLNTGLTTMTSQKTDVKRGNPIKWTQHITCQKNIYCTGYKRFLGESNPTTAITHWENRVCSISYYSQPACVLCYVLSALHMLNMYPAFCTVGSFSSHCILYIVYVNKDRLDLTNEMLTFCWLIIYIMTSEWLCGIFGCINTGQALHRGSKSVTAAFWLRHH